MSLKQSVAVIRGDGIGIDVTEATLQVVEQAMAQVGDCALDYNDIAAGAGYYKDHGVDIEPGGEEKAGESDAIFLGAIGLPSIRHPDGTEISPHLRLRDRYGLYAGVRPIKAYPNAPQRLADPRAAGIDMIILRESTEGLFYSAAVHNRSKIVENEEVYDSLLVSRNTTERLHKFAFNLARRRKARGKLGRLTCVDKANVFKSMAFFRQIFDEIKAENPDMTDAQIEFSIGKLKEFGIVDSGDSESLGIGAITDARVEDFYGKMVRAGVVPDGLDLEAVYTSEFVNKGLGLDLRPAE